MIKERILEMKKETKAHIREIQDSGVLERDVDVINLIKIKIFSFKNIAGKEMANEIISEMNLEIKYGIKPIK